MVFKSGSRLRFVEPRPDQLSVVWRSGPDVCCGLLVPEVEHQLPGPQSGAAVASQGGEPDVDNGGYRRGSPRRRSERSADLALRWIESSAAWPTSAQPSLKASNAHNMLQYTEFRRFGRRLRGLRHRFLGYVLCAVETAKDNSGRCAGRLRLPQFRQIAKAVI